MPDGCPDEVVLFAAFRGELPGEELPKAYRHVLDCIMCHEQWRRFALDEQVASGIRSALLGDAQGADGAPGLRAAVELPDRVEIPGFRMLGPFVEGGQARVFRAVHEASQEEVAIKVFRHSPLNEAGTARFFRELKSLARLRHPHVVPIRSEGETHGHAYFVMPWIQGLPLDEFVRKSRLTLPKKLQLVAKVCSALDHAHKHGVMHLDLKPSNVRVDLGGEPVVMDFGLAKLSGEVTQDAGLGIAGTPPYMAPEQVRDPDNVDIRADIYTLGLLMHEVLAERRAKCGDLKTGENIKMGAALEAPQPLREVAPEADEALAAMVARATAENRGDRYRTADDLRADIGRYLAGQAVEAMVNRPIYQARKFARQHLVGLTGVAAIGLILLSGLYMRYEADRFVNDAYKLVSERLDDFYGADSRRPVRVYLYNELGDVYGQLANVCADLSATHARLGDEASSAKYRELSAQYAEKSKDCLQPAGLRSGDPLPTIPEASPATAPNNVARNQ